MVVITAPPNGNESLNPEASSNEVAASITTGTAGAGQTAISGISPADYQKYVESKKESKETTSAKSEPKNMAEVIQQQLAQQEAQTAESQVQIPAKYSSTTPEDRIVTSEGGSAPAKSLENIILVETTGKTTSGDMVTIIAPLSKFNQDVKDQILTPELTQEYNAAQIEAANKKKPVQLDTSYNPYSHGTTRETPVSERPGVQETVYKVYDDTGKKVNIPQTSEQIFQQEQYSDTLKAMGLGLVDFNNVQTYVDTYVKDPVGRFDPVFPIARPDLVNIAQPNLDFTTSGERIEQWKTYEGEEATANRAISSALAPVELATAFLPMGAGIVGRIVVIGAERILGKVASAVVEKELTNMVKSSGIRILKGTATFGGNLAGFGTLVNIGSETPISEKIWELSSGRKESATERIENSNSIPESISSLGISLGSGLIGGGIDIVGSVPAATAGIGKITKLIVTGKFIEAGSTIKTGLQNTAEGFKTWVLDIPKNPSYAIGELIGFSWAYKKLGRTVPKAIETVGEKTGIVDTRIVDTGNVVASQNPLLSAAIDSGAIHGGGMLRLDTTSRVSLQGTHIKIFDNVGSKITVKTNSGTKVASIGTPNPLTKVGELDIQRLQSEYGTYARQDGIPFTYGTASSKSGAGTVLGLLDQTPNYISSASKSFALNSILPIQYTPRGARVLKYDMADPVSILGKSTPSATLYQPGMMSRSYDIAKGKAFDTTDLPMIIANRKGFTPTVTPKRASADAMWRSQYEREHAWTTPTGTSPVFEKTSFGGYTRSGMRITNLGSDKSLFQTLAENRAANLDTVKNPAVRTPAKELNLRNAPASVIEFYGRDVAFRLAEIVGKPRDVIDITAHGSAHVETVEKLAQTLKSKQPETYSKISEREIYYASILHDVAKNTAYESVPGGHGEMVGSVLRSKSSLDARTYLNPDAVKEFDAILGPEGVSRYNSFLEGWAQLTPKQKINVANAISQHTTNLKGPLGQTHRITANKLGRLISDADRIDLRRFSAQPETFTPKKSKVFASREVVESTIQDVFGTSAIRTQDSKNIRSPSSSGTSFKATYTPKTEQRPYPGAEYTKKSGNAPSFYPSGTSSYDTYTPKTKQRPYPGAKYSKKLGYVPTPYPSGTIYKDTYTPKTEQRTYPGAEYTKKSGYAPSSYSSTDIYRTSSTPKTAPILYSPRSQSQNLVYISRKSRDDDEKKRKRDSYARIRRETITHLSILDPLEYAGKGSITNRKQPERVIFKKPIYAYNGSLSLQKPKGARKRKGII